MSISITDINRIIEQAIQSAECNTTNDSESNQVFGIYFDIETGGASGGSCFGDQASNYYVSQDEQIDDLSNKLFYCLNDDILKKNGYKNDDIKIACHSISENYIYNSTSSNNGYGGDYYGNHTDYSSIGIPFYEFFESFLNSEDFLLFKNEAEIITNENLRLTRIEENKKSLSIVNSQISSFHSTKNNEEVSLIKQIQNMKNTLTFLEKQLKGFDKNKDLELNDLLNRKKELENILNSPIKPKK